MSRRTVLATATDAPTTTESIEPFTQDEQSDKVKKERFTKKPTSRQNKETTKRRNKVAKRPKKSAFQPSDIIKGQRGIPVKKSTTLRSLVRGVWWGRKPLLELLNKRVRLVNGQFLNKRTTLLSLVRNMPMSNLPLVDVVSNKIL